MAAHLFVNIPFCRERCAFCNRRVYLDSPAAQHDYVDALLRELASAAPDLTDSEVVSVRLGGGSPTVLAEEELLRLTDAIRRAFAISADAEWTVEVSPNRVNTAWMVAFQRAGINRLSVGMVTGRQRECELLGMCCNLPSAEVALILPQMYHLASYEAVLLYGLPGETPDTLLTSAHFPVKYNAPEITFRRLEQPTGSAWLQKGLTLPEAPVFPEKVRSYLAERGYTEYLPLRWCKPGHESRDALGEAGGADYLSLGADTVSRTDGVVYRTEPDRLLYQRHADDPERLYTVLGRAE